MVERPAVNRMVAGSSPAVPAKDSTRFLTSLAGSPDKACSMLVLAVRLVESRGLLNPRIADVLGIDQPVFCTVRSAFTADYGAGYGNRKGVSTAPRPIQLTVWDRGRC